MKTYNRYENGIDHTWYDSSNIIYTQCCDKGDAKSLRVVFKGGRVYLYRNVDTADYVMMRDSESTGESANRYIIKKYKAVRLEDVSLDELDEMKNRFLEEDRKRNEELGNLRYHLEFNRQNGELRLKYDGRTIFEGEEGKISIIKLFSSMGIAYSMSDLEEPLSTTDDFERKNLLEVAEKGNEEETITEEAEKQ